MVENLFPEEDRCLYLDADIIVNDNIWEFYHLDFGGADIAACPKPIESIAGGTPPKPLVGQEERYFNAGVLMLNLSKLRERDLVSECSEVISTVPGLRYGDQDILNIIFLNSCRLMDWSLYNFIVGNAKYSKSNDHCIYHYAGPLKPWTARYKG